MKLVFLGIWMSLLAHKDPRLQSRVLAVKPVDGASALF